MFQNGQTVPRCNPKRQRGRALHELRISSCSETLELADASGYMKSCPNAAHSREQSQSCERAN